MAGTTGMITRRVSDLHGRVVAYLMVKILFGDDTHKRLANEIIKGGTKDVSIIKAEFEKGLDEIFKDSQKVIQDGNGYHVGTSISYTPAGS